jgi:hypothetical protein
VICPPDQGNLLMTRRTLVRCLTCAGLVFAAAAWGPTAGAQVDLIHQPYRLDTGLSFWYEPLPSAPLPALPDVAARTADVWSGD